MYPKFRFNVPEGYAIDLTMEPEEEGVVYAGENGCLEIAFAYLDDVSAEQSIKEFLDGLEAPYQMLSEIEKVTIAGLDGLQCRYEVEGDYYYEVELELDIPEAYQPVSVLSLIMRSDSREGLAALEKDLNVAQLVKVL